MSPKSEELECERMTYFFCHINMSKCSENNNVLICILQGLNLPERNQSENHLTCIKCKQGSEFEMASPKVFMGAVVNFASKLKLE